MSFFRAPSIMRSVMRKFTQPSHQIFKFSAASSQRRYFSQKPIEETYDIDLADIEEIQDVDIKKMSAYEIMTLRNTLTEKYGAENAQTIINAIRPAEEVSQKMNGFEVFGRKGAVDPEMAARIFSQPQERYEEVTGGPSRYSRYFMGSLVLAFLFYYFTKYNEATKKTTTSMTHYQTVQKIALGGPFEGLIDQDGVERSSADYDGFYRLMYFGFTECPDICPTELRKMIKALKIVRTTHPEYYEMIKPIFISVDTRRDTPSKLKEYSQHFTPNIVWLTGPEDNIRNAAKKYRVHYSIPDDIEEGENYNVDHSIFFYFMDKQNNFVNFFGQSMNSTQIAESIIDRLNTDHGKMDSEKFPRKK